MSTEHSRSDEFDDGEGVDCEYESSATHILFRLVAAGEPLTIAELADRVDIGKTGVHVTVLELYRRGYLLRRERRSASAPAPNEYIVRDPSGGALSALYAGPPKQIERQIDELNNRLRRLEDELGEDPP
jgi:predicted DNA-binding transcriptional regulator